MKNRKGMVRTTVYGVRIATVLLILYWLAIFTGTHWPRVSLPRIDNIDKVFHCVGFAGLAFLMAWAIPTQIGKPRWNVLIAAVVCVSYAAIDEFTQIPVGRTADVADWMADCLGVLLGLTAYLVTRTLLWRHLQFSPAQLPMPQ